MSQPNPVRESLKVLLAKVHERLREEQAAENGSQEQLLQVMGDIERALQKRRDAQAAGGAVGPEVVEAVAAAQAQTPRLEALAIQFEADHPALSAQLRRLVDLLGKAGI